MDGQTLPTLVATHPTGDDHTGMAWLLVTPLLALPDNRHDWPSWWQGIEYVMLRWLADEVDTLDPAQVTWQVHMFPAGITLDGSLAMAGIMAS